jgi:hypothetical protein
VLVRFQLLPGRRQSVGQGLFKPFAVAGRLAPAGGWRKAQVNGVEDADLGAGRM